MEIYVAVAVLGGLVGAAEVVTRYRDAPGKALRIPTAVIYVSINGFAGMLTLYLMRAFGLTVGGETDAQRVVLQVLVAGFGAMALLRSSLFTVRVGDTDVGVGPSALLTALLGAADRDIDKRRGAARVEDAVKLMRGFDFDRHGEALLNVVFAAMQNLTPEEIGATTKAVEEIQGLTSAQEKAVTFGLLLLDFAGGDLVRRSISALESPKVPHAADGATPSSAG